MAFEFIKDLSEARVFRNPANLPSVGLSNIAQNFFNATLALQIMRYENPKLAKKYAQQTLSNGLDGWRSSGSDFNNMAQILLNPERYSEKINIDTQITVPELQLKTWLRHIAKGTADETADRRFFLALQRRLGVDSPGLISARRVAADWSRSLSSERTQATARVYRGLSHDLKQSDLFTLFARIASKQGATDNTKSGGIPLWAKLAAAGAGGYYLGKKIASW